MPLGACGYSLRRSFMVSTALDFVIVLSSAALKEFATALFDDIDPVLLT